MLALDAYKEKRLDEARVFCQNALREKPDNPACLYLMGTLEFDFHRFDKAEALMRRSVELMPTVAQTHFGLAQVLASLGKNQDAQTHYEKTIELKADHAEAWFGLGNVRSLLGQREEGAKAYEKTLDLKPDHAAALNNLGVFFCDKGAYDNAVRLHKKALALCPSYAAAYNNLGNAYKGLKKWDEALSCYRQALDLDPNLFQALNNIGLSVMYGKGDLHEAARFFRKALDIRPDNVAALTHLGITFCMQGNFEEGAACYEKALAVDPHYRDALNNMGNALKALGRTQEALDYYKSVQDLTPDDPELHNSIAMAYLALGRFQEGWNEYEWRWKSSQFKGVDRLLPGRRWQGEKGPGKTLFIYAEQGFGDTIQFCRFASLAAKEKGLRVLVEAQPELVSLLASLEGVESVFPLKRKLPKFDYHCAMLSLPLGFQTTADTIPANGPYLFANPEKTRLWAERLAEAPSKSLKVGLVWTGNPRRFSLDLAMTNVRRSLNEDSLAPLADLPGIRFYSLQKKGFSLSSDFPIVDLMPLCADFSDTAAFIDNLDLVISVDTAVAHLAGAMGKPVWLLNRFDSCWRWFRDREDSPWYPTMRLFRQSAPGDWDSVIDRVRDELKLLTQTDHL
ncbi:MAG: tetratricopeptide repeat protein [Alphaproteobacteria bacterium]|nr:tetratricopeptide repeat protein [Alphaproteobacteria bacterium]